MKRVKVTLNKPNPLFELWLEQWREKAALQGSSLQFNFIKALNALRRYPLPLESGKDCIILKHFGSKLCMMLDKKLEEFKIHQQEIAQSNKICKCDNCACNELSLLQERKRNQIYKEKLATFKMGQTEARHTKFTLPSWSFTCYAILLTLYGKEEDPSYPGYMCTSELFYESKKLYNATLQLLDPDIYGEKSSIFILISNELICLRQFPIRYHLTKHGAHLAKKISNILNLSNYNKKFLQAYFMKLQDSLQTLSYNSVINKIDLEFDESILPLRSRAGKSPKKINKINLMEEEENNTISCVLDYGNKHNNDKIDFELDEPILPLYSRAGKSPEKISEIDLIEEEESNTISYVLDRGKKQNNKINLGLDEPISSLHNRASKSPKKISKINLIEEEESKTISYVLGRGKKHNNKIDLELDEPISSLHSRASKSPKKISKINLIEEEESNTISYVLDRGKKQNNKINLGLDEPILPSRSRIDKSPKKISKINLTKEEENNTVSCVPDYSKMHDKIYTIKQSSNVITNTLNEVQGTVQLKPYTFDIILLVDIQETCGGKTKPQDDLTLAELTQLGVPFEVRHLKVGDFTWIARCKYTKNELVLPYIVERKRLDDLSASIKDGRFREQKFRLKQSGIQNLFYLVEKYERYSQAAITLQTLLQASINSLVQDGFIVKYTDSHQDSMSYLAILTDTLCRIYAEKNLIECNKEDLIPIDVTSSSILLMKFEEFNKASSKLKNFSVRQMFLRQLLQLKGISVPKALAIVQNYPTPQILINALHKSDCGETLIAPIQYGLNKRQIGPAISKTIYLFYTQHELQ